MRVSVLVLICAVVVLVPLGVWWLGRTDALLRVAGADPRYVQTVPDRVRYTSMGAIVLLTATAATASLTLALSLVFHGAGLAESTCRWACCGARSCSISTAGS